MSSIIQIINATANNLKGVSTDIPRNAFICFVGRSGSGKSSFGIDVLFHGCVNLDQGISDREENVVRGAIPAIAVRQRLQPEHSVLSVAKALGFSDTLQRFHPELHQCMKCGGKGALARLLPERAIIDESRPLSKTALHPLLRPIISIAKKRLSSTFIEPIFSSLPNNLRSQFLFGPACEDGWGGLQQELLCAASNGQIETSIRDMHQIFYDHIACPACGGVGLEGLIGDMDAHIVDFSKAFPLWKIIGDCLRSKILPLSSPVSRLSAGEHQWLRVISAIKETKPGMLVLLDEPTAGMCKYDAEIIAKLCRDLVLNNCTVVAIEHSPIVMINADYIVEFGPGGGAEGGQITFSGTLDCFLKKGTAMGKAIGDLCRTRAKPETRFKATLGIEGTEQYGLGNVELALPENRWTCIAGAIGTGKSGCIDIIFRAMDKSPGAWTGRIGLGKVVGHNKIRRPHLVDQNPIGLNPHSIPLTYIDAMTELRRLFCDIATSQSVAFGVSNFSFNTKEGRCDVCDGYGCVEKILAGEPYWQLCTECKGLRYNKKISKIKYKGLTIGEILKLTVAQSVNLFNDEPLIARKLDFLKQVGLGYLVIGQPSNSLSGGESQRVKIARQLAKKLGDRTLYLLDTPSRGLSPVDSGFMISVFRGLAARNTVIIADNHPCFVQECDWLVVLGNSGKTTKQLYAGPPTNAPQKLIEQIAGIATIKNAMKESIIREQ